MNKKNHRLAFLSIFMMLCIPMAKNLVLSPQSFSDLENRVLSQKILWDRELLQSGVLAERTETYFQDQFPFRDVFINLKSDVQVLMGKKRNNGIYLGRKGYLFPVSKAYEEAVLKDNLQAVLALQSGLEDSLRILVVPPSSLVLEELIPRHAGVKEENAVLDEISDALSCTGSYVDVHGVLEENEDADIYFRTDHHWTQYGAYLAYSELMNSISLEPVDIGTFTVDKTPDFHGTYYSRFRGNFIPGEEFTLYESRTGEYTVEYEGEDRLEKRILFRENLAIRDKYRVYLDGNYPLIRVKNQDASSKEKVLVLKDSYANAMVPFLGESFTEVHFLDLRYFNLSLKEYMETEGFQKVILLQGMDSLMGDVNLKKLGY